MNTYTIISYPYDQNNNITKIKFIYYAQNFMFYIAILNFRFKIFVIVNSYSIYSETFDLYIVKNTYRIFWSIILKLLVYIYICNYLRSIYLKVRISIIISYTYSCRIRTLGSNQFRTSCLNSNVRTSNSKVYL